MWYEKLDFEENPFKDTEETELIGYEDLIDEMLYMIHSSNIIFIEGREGSGKTAILKKAINRFKGKGKVIFLDCNDINNLNIEASLKNKYGFFGKLFNNMPNDMILLFDGIENLSQKNCERIKYFYDQNYIKSIVFTGSDYSKVDFTESLKDRIAEVKKIKQLSEDEAVEIVESRLKNNNIFTEDQIKNIFKRSNRIPKKFLQNIEAICEKVIDDNRKEATKEDINTILGEEKREKKIEKVKKKTIKQKTKEKKEPPKEKIKESKEEEKKENIDEGIKVIYEDIAEKYY